MDQPHLQCAGGTFDRLVESMPWSMFFKTSGKHPASLTIPEGYLKGQRFGF